MVVILVSVISMAYFTYLFTQDTVVNKIYLNRIDSCSDGQELCYAIWYKWLANFRLAQLLSAIIGISLPVLFFGGRALVNYIAPET